MWFSSSNLKAQVIKHWKMLAFFSSPPTSWPNLNSKVFEACKMSHYFAHGAGKWTSSIPVVWENEVNPSCFVFIKKQWAKKISQSDSQRELSAKNFKPHSSVRSHFREYFYISQLSFSTMSFLTIIFKIHMAVSNMTYCL